ncbi:hemolysin III family protein [Cellulomonas sp. zg-ZUI222]|uniref:Hemolysin III family protein n=1 Tax=Cellulomonas wangleii TaxID=2816956 RepID=A0ABX8D740_9CELL|nr:MULTISPECIES: hemolysin III family protein [Cellulomonas]MBO0901624.1 hemolysin III family protein [Cellulomonas sp. zg-ZUI22]MBO0922257.1 hemolysin III family protein [Cellulomonas wangleii]MBO0925952.1 hemolysin III family protein [Cellulomonas wangleii]QVI63254.1 hemolysin III family protein [Cellulomonas wangleii]
MSTHPAPGQPTSRSAPATPGAPADDTHEAGPVARAADAVGDAVEAAVEAVKPRLRGMIHAGVAPIALVASIALVALSPTSAARWSTAVFGVTAVLLFGTSAVYHRGTWSPRTAALLRRLDHTNIFLIIAGTYTPLAVLLLPPATARSLLLIVWSGAVVGMLARIFWLGAPRWVYVPIYLALGWVAVGYFPQFWQTGGATVVGFIAVGGLAYTVGAIIYGMKRPNPSPRWFGFHEIFHALTVVGYGCHFVAVAIAVSRLA